MAKKGPVRLTTAQVLDAVGIDAICEKVADCTTLRVIAEECGVSKGSLLAWLSQYPDQYARAREAQADVLASDILAIADQCRIGEKKISKPDGGIEIVTADMVERSRLQIDARKWLAGKMSPKKYSDKIALGGADDLPPIKQQTEVTISAEEFYKRLLG